MSAGGPLLNGQPEADTVFQVAVGLQELPIGQRVALTITALLPKDAALQVADAVKTTAEQLSSTRLVVAKPGANGAVGQQPS